MAKTKKKFKKWPMMTWFLLVIMSLLFGIMLFNFALFPTKWKLPVLVVVGIVLVLTAIASFHKFHAKGRLVTSIINVILTIVMIIGSVMLPMVEKNVKGIFTNVTTTDVKINVYALTTEYKSAHADVFKATGNVITSDDIEDYGDKTFLTQVTSDQENQAYALDLLKNLYGTDVKTNQKEDIVDALTAFYQGEGDALILSEAYEPTISEIAGFETFTTDTEILYTITKEVEVETPADTQDITSNAFSIMIAGSDTRSTALSTYGRTDVDIILTVNPDTKQILLVSIPRDYYIPNPALGNGNDKLTHLGNNGIQNTMTGLGSYFGIDITEYAIVNFSTFSSIVDALDGIDVNNPYYFTTVGGNGSLDGTPFYFDTGMIHLDGKSALAYCRERYNLSNGDYGRNEHQAIVLQAIIQKLTSSAVVSNATDVLSALQGKVLTSVSSDAILKLASSTLSSDTGWNIVSYNLGGTGTMQGTASLGWSRMLYTVVPFESQVHFVNEQVNKVLNGEVIAKEEIPGANDTTYLPN